MTASTSKSAPAPGSPSRTNNSSQMSGVFGKCTEPIPTNIQSVRAQQQAAQRAKESLSPDANAKFTGNEGYSSKTVSKPHCHPSLKKKAGSVPMPDVNIFSPPEATVHKVRTTQQHTDPFSEERPRAEIKKRKLLVPECTTKAPKACSVRVSEATKAKWESPYAADDVTNSLAASEACPSPTAMSPTRSSHASSPTVSTKRCARVQEGGNGIFDVFTHEELTASRQQSHVSQASGSRYKHSGKGHATMHTELTEAEISKERTQHKRLVHPHQTTMEGVFTVVEKKNRHPNYKIHAPFARQGSIAASARIGGKRHKKTSEAAARGEVVSPYANALDAQQETPAEISPSCSRKVFSDKHSSKTPFARVNSLPPSKGKNYARRQYAHAQKATSPFATEE